MAGTGLDRGVRAWVHVPLAMTARRRQLSAQDWGTSRVWAPHAGDALAGGQPPSAQAPVFQAPVFQAPVAQAPAAPAPPSPLAPSPVERPPRVPPAEPAGQAAALPTSPVDREGMYRGLLWVAWAVEECSRAYTRLSSRMGKLESRVDILESAPRRAGAAPAPAVVAPPPSPPVIDLGKQTKDRIDGIEQRVRQLEYLSLKVANIQRSVDQLEKTPPPAAVAPPEPVSAEEEPDAAEVDLEAVYQELDRIAEFVAARVTPLERAVEQIRRGAATHGHDDADRRLAELEARLQRFERMFTAMQAGLQVGAR